MSDAVGVGIVLTDAELRVIAWDPWLARITGLDAAAVRGRTLAEIVPDLDARGLLGPLRAALATGVVEMLAPAMHQAFIPCPPETPSPYFDRMQQRVTIGPLRHGDRIVGLMITIEDVTARRERERSLAAELRSSDPAVRMRAARVLADTDGLPIDGVPVDGVLAGLLDDGSWRVRRAAVWSLARRRDDALVAALLVALRDGGHQNFSVLSGSLTLLALADVDVVAPLVEFLRGPDAGLSIHAAHALGDRPDPRSTAALLEALDAPDPNVRFHAVESLGRLGAVDAVEPLVSIAESRDFFLAFPALDALAAIGDRRVAPRLVPLLDDEVLCSAASETLGRLGDVDAIPALVALLGRPEAPLDAVVRALRMLHDRADEPDRGSMPGRVRATVDAAGTQALLDAVDHAGIDTGALALVLGWLEGAAVARALTRLLARPGARGEVLDALVASGPAVVELLVDQLGAEDLETRQAAVVALGRIGDRRATVPLLEAVRRDPELMVQGVQALGLIGDGEAFETLVRSIGHPDGAVRRASVGALLALDDDRTAGTVTRLLAEADERTRESAVKVAAQLGDRRCAAAVLGACTDASETVRRAAVEVAASLDSEGGPSLALAALGDGAASVRAAAARGLAGLRDAPSFDALCRALHDPDSWVRYFAVRSLGRRRDAEGAARLASVIEREPARHVLIATIEALGEIGGARSVSTLSALAANTDDEVAKTAELQLVGLAGNVPPGTLSTEPRG